MECREPTAIGSPGILIFVSQRMDSREEDKPGLPDPKKGAPKRPRKTGKKKKPKAETKHLSIIRSVAERENLATGGQPKKPAATSPESPADEPTRFFREVSARRSVQPAEVTQSRPRKIGRTIAPKARPDTLRLLGFRLKVARRHIRRFHSRYTPRQILAFYLGVPASLSLLVCIGFLLNQPPAADPAQRTGIHEQKPEELIQIIQAGLKNPASGNLEAASLDFIGRFPNDPRASVARGTVLAFQKNYSEARKFYLRALELSPGLASALLNLGELEFHEKNYQQAAAYYRQAAQKAANNPVIYFRLYLCYSLLNDHAAVAATMEKFPIRPFSVEWYFVQASEALHNGRKPEAERLIATARSLFGERAGAYQESLEQIGWIK